MNNVALATGLPGYPDELQLLRTTARGLDRPCGDASGVAELPLATSPGVLR